MSVCRPITFTTMRCIAMKFGTDIQGAQRINPNDFADHLIFPLVTLAAQSCHLSCEIAQHLLD